MGDLKKNYTICGMRHGHFRIGSILQIGCAAAVMLLGGCAPSLYSVNMKYVPTRSFPRTAGVISPVAVTIATFQDVRKIEDKMLLGHVIKSNWEQIPVLPKFVMPSKAITEPIKEFFRGAGYRVSAESPAWDLSESSINKGWGPILVGGSIDELDVVCQDSLTVTKYTAKVKLTLFFANALVGKVFYTVTTESSSSLDHILFSEERLEEQLNIALSDAIEKIFEGKDITSIINEAAKRKP